MNKTSDKKKIKIIITICLAVFILAAVIKVCLAGWNADWDLENGFDSAYAGHDTSWEGYDRRGVDIDDGYVYSIGTVKGSSGGCGYSMKLNKRGKISGDSPQYKTWWCNGAGYDIDVFNGNIYIAGEYYSEGEYPYSEYSIIKINTDLNPSSQVIKNINPTTREKDAPNAIAADGTGVYTAGGICGRAGPGTDFTDSWWYVAKFDQGLAGPVWDKTENMTDYALAEDIAVDDTGVYIVGKNNNTTYRIEKRDKSNGSLISAFDGDGIITGSGANVWGVAVDGAGLYIAGNGGVQKRNSTTGALVSGFGSGGWVGSLGAIRDIKIHNGYLYAFSYAAIYEMDPATGEVFWNGNTGRESSYHSDMAVDNTGFYHISTGNTIKFSYHSPAWTDPAITAGVSGIKKTHIEELRAEIDDLREDFYLAPYTWTDPALAAGSTPIKAVHFTEMRTAIEAVYAAAGKPLPLWTDSIITSGVTIIKKAHLDELRSAMGGFGPHN